MKGVMYIGHPPCFCDVVIFYNLRFSCSFVHKKFSSNSLMHD